MKRREFIRSAVAAGVLAALAGSTMVRPENGDFRVDDRGAVHHYWWDGEWYPAAIMVASAPSEWSDDVIASQRQRLLAEIETSTGRSEVREWPIGTPGREVAVVSSRDDLRVTRFTAPHVALRYER